MFSSVTPSLLHKLISCVSWDGDGDGNKNDKKAIGLDWQNNNFARASLFFVHFFAVVARLQRETVWFHVL